MNGNLTLRRMRPGEEGRLWEVLRSAVLKGTAEHYDDAQRKAWAPSKPEISWPARLSVDACFVALLDTLVVGFMAADEHGHIDLAYVLPDMKNSGIGTRLLERIEGEMQLNGVRRLTTDASLVAQPFFERRGWTSGRTETVTRNGQSLRRVKMHKNLT
ncbi:GNAT family N-acetyltransferase [Roseitranquillus sediminis]|uniref:GNAT family N-acetyltransferase n=1 Tax=Roseitranquillus sediminis TaxID=2809051 RepID=UPI001D0CBF21|nr:GNAT family N-acetyltransferase [Roseitranquillus sediminis]MBM9595357.1 GNAT family N-acetyltransferase [Roseitranquillus sediminis]